MIATLFLLQAAAQAPAQSAPDIELVAHARARSVTIEKKGEAKLTVRSEPDGGNLVDVRAPKANGQRTLRNVEVDVHAEARIGDPQRREINPDQAETPRPQ
jgi:hypothetical protein